MDRDRLSTILECPVCNRLSRDARMHLCVEGHGICFKCLDTMVVPICPSGQCRFNDPPTRNAVAEKILKEADLEFPCRNDEFGCWFKAPRIVLEEHEEKCDFRRIRCPVDLCSELVPVKTVLEHIQDCHKDVGTAVCNCGDADFSCVYGFFSQLSGREYSGLTLVKVRDEAFLFRLEKPANAPFFLFLQVLGDRKMAQEQWVQIAAQGNDAKYRKKCQVYPVDVSLENIKNDLGCFQMSEQMVKTFCTSESLEDCVKQRGFELQLRVKFKIIVKE